MHLGSRVRSIYFCILELAGYTIINFKIKFT